MFIPNALLIEPCTEVRWSNPSNLPHNVVGILNQTIGSNGTESTNLIPNNSTTNTNNNTRLETAEAIAIDSGFIEPSASWQYRFNEESIGNYLNYLCTIHAEEGMRGTVIVTRSLQSPSL